MNAFGYLRVSGKGQVEGDGFPRQRAAIEAYAKSNGLTVVRWFEEKGVSGTIDGLERPEWSEMVEQCPTGTVVVVERLDRLARDLMVQEAALKDARQRGLTVISTAEPDLCSDDPTRKLMRQIMGAIAEWDKAQITAKLRAARDRKRARGERCEGQRPFGSRPGEQEAIERLRAVYAEVGTYQKTADVLNAEHVPARHGQWFGVTVKRVLEANPMIAVAAA